jgi:hypothetical protein
LFFLVRVLVQDICIVQDIYINNNINILQMSGKTNVFSDLVTLKTIEKILTKNFPNKKPAEIDDLAVGLKQWLQKESNYKKVEKIAKNVCSKKKGGGKTRKRKRKRKKRTRRRHGGNGDSFLIGRMRLQDIGLMIMLGLGVWLLDYWQERRERERVRQQNERMGRYQRQRSRAPPPAESETKETKDDEPPHHRAITQARAQNIIHGYEDARDLIEQGETKESATTANDAIMAGLLDQDSDSE